MPDNVKIARGVFEDLFGKGKLDFVDQNFDPGYRGHETLIPDYNRDQAKKNVQMYRTAFPDLSVTCDEVVGSGDKVLIRWTCQGTHRGPFAGNPPTGKKTKVSGITILNFSNG